MLIAEVLQKKNIIAFNSQKHHTKLQTYDCTIKLNHNAIKTLKINKLDATKFFAIKSFFMYNLGPLQQAIAAISDTIANVKHIENLAGIKAIEGIRNTHIIKKNAAIPTQISAPIQLTSFGKKLNIDSHPCGSGSGLPSTKFLAPQIIPDTPPEEVDCLSRSLELIELPPYGLAGGFFET